jgi:hypothetical protein
MKEKAHIKTTKALIYISVLSLFFFSSCGFDEIGEVTQVKVKAHPKVVLPIAFGSIDINALFNYVSPNEEDFPPDENGYYSFEQIFTEISLPDTITFDGSFLEKFTDVELRIETTNHLPLGIDIDFHFVDTLSYSKLGIPVTCSLIKPAAIDNEGKAIASTHYIENVKITKKQLREYVKASAVIMIINFYLPESESNTILLKKDDFLELNVGMAVQVTTGE